MSTREIRRTPRELVRLKRWAEIDDTDLGARLLRGMPTNEARTPELLREWSERAQRFGRDLAVRHDGSSPEAEADGDRVSVVERQGGLTNGNAVIAHYSSKTHVVEVFLDSVEFCERLVDDLGWRDVFAPGAIRAAAIAHEHAHEVLGRDRGRALREAIHHDVFHIGAFHRYAYVPGTDELAAHAFAQASLGLSRSPLLITAAAMAALDGPLLGNDAGAVESTDKDNPSWA